jgi:hypothetical protein
MSRTEQLLERKSSGSGLENRDYGCRDHSRWPRDTLYPQKLALTSPTSGGCSVSIVHSRTETSLSLLPVLYVKSNSNTGLNTVYLASLYRVWQANFLFYMGIFIWKRKLACRTLYCWNKCCCKIEWKFWSGNVTLVQRVNPIPLPLNLLDLNTRTYFNT